MELTCKVGHVLKRIQTKASQDKLCDQCTCHLSAAAPLWHCKPCGQNVCFNCARSKKVHATDTSANTSTSSCDDSKLARTIRRSPGNGTGLPPLPRSPGCTRPPSGSSVARPSVDDPTVRRGRTASPGQTGSRQHDAPARCSSVSRIKPQPSAQAAQRSSSVPPDVRGSTSSGPSSVPKSGPPQRSNNEVAQASPGRGVPARRAPSRESVPKRRCASAGSERHVEFRGDATWHLFSDGEYVKDSIRTKRPIRADGHTEVLRMTGRIIFEQSTSEGLGDTGENFRASNRRQRPSSVPAPATPTPTLRASFKDTILGPLSGAMGGGLPPSGRPSSRQRESSTSLSSAGATGMLPASAKQRARSPGYAMRANGARG